MKHETVCTLFALLFFTDVAYCDDDVSGFDLSSQGFLQQDGIPAPHESFSCPNPDVYYRTMYVFLCAHRCVEKGAECKSFNYQAYLEICEICPAVPSDEALELEHQPGWEYGRRDQYDEVGLKSSPCRSNPCLNEGRCYESSAYGTYECICKTGNRFIGPTCETPVTDGGWGEWISWTECTSSCNAGYKTRTRECDSPEPGDGGDPCPGRGIDYSKCNMQICPVWSMWSWVPCVPIPGSRFLGRRRRSRECLFGGTPNVDPGCSGHDAETISCRVLSVRSVRLSGSSMLGQGRVEVFLEDRRQWGTICNDQWDKNDADVVCRELGFSEAHSATATVSSVSDLRIVMTDVTCTGDEDSLAFCSYGDEVSALGCTHANDAGVTCVIDGGWGKWSPWGACTGPCKSNNVRNRTRACDWPTPANGGRTCSGDAMDTKWCRKSPSPCNCELGYIEHGTVTGSVSHKGFRTFTCTMDEREKFTLFGEATSQCFDGSWTQPIPVCKESCILPLDSDVTSGIVVGDNVVIHGQTANVQCDPYHQLDDPVLTCNEGSWEPTSQPKCKMLDSCHKVFSIGTTSYCISKKESNWEDAADVCAESGGKLVKFESVGKFDSVVDTILVPDAQFPYWCGLRKVDVSGNFIWTDGTGGGYRTWSSEPADPGCVELTKKDEMTKKDCSDEKMFVCEK